MKKIGEYMGLAYETHKIRCGIVKITEIRDNMILIEDWDNIRNKLPFVVFYPHKYNIENFIMITDENYKEFIHPDEKNKARTFKAFKKIIRGKNK